MIAIIKSMCLCGLEGIVIDVEVDVSSGIPCWEIVGLPDTNIKESKERVKTAIKNCNIELLSRKYIINLSPANIHKNGAIFDLAIAVGILYSIGTIKPLIPNDTIFIGELSLSGKLNRVNGILTICSEAVKYGIKRVILPKENAEEAAIVQNIEVIGVSSLKDVIDYLNGKIKIKPTEINLENILNEKENEIFDFSEVKGQLLVKRGLEIAAAGGHNCLLIGTPGSGKTMLAQRLPSILPDLTFKEALEITKIYSITGNLKQGGLITKRPFRSPHHTITEKALIGGGKYPKPGEISLAHLGVLFLDELLEFKKSTIEVLRGPIEDKKVDISRAQMVVSYPCNFMIIGSMNPCPCGYYGSKVKECTCTEMQRKLYRAKLSGPMQDRFDLQISVFPIEYKNIKYNNVETSMQIKERVNLARKIQNERYKDEGIYCNSELTPKLIEKYCNLSNDSEEILKNSFNKLNLSARGYYKILKVSRTIADLDNEKQIKVEHILEAMQYRNLDKLEG